MSVLQINYSNQTTVGFTCGYDYYLADASGGNVNVTLDKITQDFMIYSVCKTDTTSNNFTMICNSGDTFINGDTGVYLNTYTNVGLMSYLGNWYIISGSANTVIVEPKKTGLFW